jgi:hypothetical protein
MAAPNIVNPTIQRGWAILSVTANTSTTITKNTVTTITYTVTGLAVGDYVHFSPSKAIATGVTAGCAYVTAANTLAIDFVNATGSDQTAAADTYLVLVGRSYPTQTDFGTTAFNNIGTVAGTNP